jgi:uncharacterized protein with GYD domain
VSSFVVLLNWTDQGIKGFRDSAARVDAFNAQMGGQGVGIKDIYWTVGPYDLVAMIDAPDEESLTAALLVLGSLGNVRTTTMRAFSRSEFDRIVERTG